MKEIYIVPQNFNDKRLDIFLNEQVESLTRSSIKNQIDAGFVQVSGKVSKAGKTLKSGDVVIFDIQDEQPIENVEPENIPLDIVYEDQDLAVINKPRGMTVHPAPGNFTGTLVNALLYHFPNVSDIGGVIRPGIVHRIDKDTTGLLVVAKNNASHVELSKQIADKTCKRTYYALVEGVFKDDHGVISEPIGRSVRDRKQMCVCSNGKTACTHFTVLERFENYTFMQFDLETGRTHQIRVHCKFMKHPIVGDMTYGYEKQKFKLDGQLLHAGKLQLIHPKTKKVMCFEAPLPEDFEKVLFILRKKTKINT